MSAPVRASGFFALRAPLLPWDELRRWSEALEAPAAAPDDLDAALRRDRERLRAGLRELTSRPAVREALVLASPALHDALDTWRADPDGARGRRCEESLVRYCLRMAARATPFGLFAGSALGRTGATTRLELAPLEHAVRRTRLDMDYVYGLADALARDPALRAGLTYRPNSSLYRAASRLRYVEVRRGPAGRTHHLVALEPTPYLDALLERARGGARLQALAETLRAAVGADEVDADEAAAFVDALVDEQALVPDLPPPVTTAEPLDDLLRTLRPHAAARATVEVLAGVGDALRALDAGGLGATPEAYAEIATRLSVLPVPVDPARLVQVDLLRTAREAELGPDVLDELARGVDLLHRAGALGGGDPLRRFRDAFQARYGEGREVPLVEALDDESGLSLDGFDPTAADASPFVAGLGLGARLASSPPWSARDAFLLERLHGLWSAGAGEWELSPGALERLAADPPPAPLPDAFQVMAVLAARSPEHLQQGDFRLAFDNASGPSGARLLGRFCHLDPALQPAIEAHLREEEAHDPEALFAEIAHLPEGRVGNVLARPVLRAYEIPYLGRSAAPEERQIPVDDLRLSLDGRRFVLRSARLGRRIVPRLTSALTFERGLGLHRLLCLLQQQGVSPGVGWSWGALESAPFLPRVSSGRLVLARARWRLQREELDELARERDAGRFRAARRLRERRRLPRLVCLVDGDRELPVDFDNILALDAFVAVTKGREAVVTELFPDADELALHGPEGRFVHELIVPFVRAEAREIAPAVAATGTAARAGARRFAPGSEWLQAKLYAGPAVADGLLTDVVTPLVERLRAERRLRSWFFIRYADPDWHLRVRFHGAPAVLLGEVLPELVRALEEPLGDGRLARWQLDTYEREVERYGGPEGVVACETLFEADSEAAAALVAALRGGAGEAERGPWTLLAVHRLLDDAGLEPGPRRALVQEMLDFTCGELRVKKPVRLQLDRRFREARARLDALLGPAPPAPLETPLQARSAASAAAFDELRRLAREGRLACSYAAVVASLVHMSVNRFTRAAGQAHEVVIYDFLRRLLASAAARSAATSRPAGALALP